MRDHIDEFAARDARVVALAPPRMGDPGTYVAKHGEFPFPLLHDRSHEVFRRYDVLSKLLSLGQRPALFVIDREGRVAYNQVGTQQTDLPPVAEILERLDALGT